MVAESVMTWLEDIDVRAADRFARALFGAPTVAELRRRALSGLAELVPADVLMWDRVDLGTGVVRHEVIPADAEPPRAFAAIVGDASGHPLLSAHAARGRPALRLSEAAAPRRLLHSELHGDLLHPSGVEYAIAIGVRAEHGEIEHSSFDAERWLAEHFEPAEHAGWLPAAVAAWLAVPPRPPLVSVRDGRRLTVQLLPGDPHALLLEEEVASFRPGALVRLGLTPRETQVLCGAGAIEEEADIVWEPCLSLHAVRDRLAHLEAKLGVHTAADAVSRALRESS
jgi:hypothetical protein